MTSTINWVYGANAPDIEQAVSDAIFAAHRYRNKLCELELAKRERHEQLLQRLAPEYVLAFQAVEAVENQLGEARDAIQAERIKQRTKKPEGVKHLQEKATACKAKLRELRATRKAAKQSAYGDVIVKDAMEANQQQHKSDVAQAKSDSGLYWGTEAIVKQACNSFSSGAPPRFNRYEGKGQLAVQLQNGLDCREALETDTRLQIIVPDELQERLLMRGKAPRSMRSAECLIRIGSEGRAPIFARVPIKFHRPLPTGRIKWAYLERRKLANKSKWSVRLTIDVPERKPTTELGTVAIHVGWRSEAQGLRVATWKGSDGRYGYLRLSNEHCADYRRLDAVKSKRDIAFNEIRAIFAEWLKVNEHPEWIAEATKYIGKWKNPAKLASIVLRWREDRFVGDSIFEELDCWRKQDKHRWQHERRLSKRVIRRRTTDYRKFCVQLEHEYHVAVVAQIDAKELTEHSQPEELKRDPNVRNAKIAAVSDLLRMIREKFQLRCIDTEAAGISQECSTCGEKNAVTKRKVQCCGCNRTYDTDENGVENTLARGYVAIENGALLELRKAKEDKAVKQQEKLAKMQEGNRAARKRKREEEQ